MCFVVWETYPIHSIWTLPNFNVVKAPHGLLLNNIVYLVRFQQILLQLSFEISLKVNTKIRFAKYNLHEKTPFFKESCTISQRIKQPHKITNVLFRHPVEEDILLYLLKHLKQHSLPNIKMFFHDLDFQYTFVEIHDMIRPHFDLVYLLLFSRASVWYADFFSWVLQCIRSMY